MTPQEKTAKIKDLERQIRKVKMVQKFLETKPYRNGSKERFMRRINRVWGLSNDYFIINVALQKLQSQPCK